MSLNEPMFVGPLTYVHRLTNHVRSPMNIGSFLSPFFLRSHAVTMQEDSTLSGEVLCVRLSCKWPCAYLRLRA